MWDILHDTREPISVSILLQKGSQAMKLAVRAFSLVVVLAGAPGATLVSATYLPRLALRSGPDSLPIPLCGPGSLARPGEVPPPELARSLK